MLDHYDFNDTLSRLDEIIQWLKGAGFNKTDRIRVYRRNIAKMLDVNANRAIDDLQATIPIAAAREIFWSYIDADEFVRTMTALRNTLGDKAAVALIEKALNGPADLFQENPNNNAGRNFMFELIIAGRLAGAGFKPSFDNGPDVHVEFAGLQVGIQCKRPSSKASLEGNIRKALQQLKNGTAELNLIAISVSRLLNNGDPFRVPQVQRHEDGYPQLEARVRQIADETSRFWYGKLSPAGILFYAFVPFRCLAKPNYWPVRCETIYPLSNDPFTTTVLRSFAESLKT